MVVASCVAGLGVTRASRGPVDSRAAPRLVASVDNPLGVPRPSRDRGAELVGASVLLVLAAVLGVGCSLDVRLAPVARASSGSRSSGSATWRCRGRSDCCCSCRAFAYARAIGDGTGGPSWSRHGQCRALPDLDPARRSASRSCGTGSTTSTSSSTAPWSTATLTADPRRRRTSAPCCACGCLLRAGDRRLRPGRRRLDPGRRRALPARCGPRSSAASTAASTAAGTTRPARLRPSPPACGDGVDLDAVEQGPARPSSATTVQPDRTCPCGCGRRADEPAVGRTAALRRTGRRLCPRAGVGPVPALRGDVAPHRSPCTSPGAASPTRCSTSGRRATRSSGRWSRCASPGTRSAG